MHALRGLLSVVARMMIAAIFLMSAVGNKIPQFSGVAKMMGEKGVPQPTILLGGAIAFLILGSLSIVLGYRGRIGALMLLVFLGAATYYFHAFWKMPTDPPEPRLEEMRAFMKNLALMGTMLFLLANGTGPWSLSNRRQADSTADDSDEADTSAAVRRGGDGGRRGA